MMSSHLTECLKKINESCEAKIFLPPVEKDNFGKFTIAATESIPQVSKLIIGRLHSESSYLIDVMELLSQLKLKKLALMFADSQPRFEICNQHIQILSRHNQREHFYEFSSDLVYAYVFYTAIEGDFLSNLKKAKLNDLSEKRFAKIQNLYLKKNFYDLSIQDANEMIILAFCYIAFILQSAKQTIKPVTKRSEFYIEPTITKSGIHEYTNCPKIAKDKGIKLSCLELEAEDIVAQHKLFPFVYGYNGSYVEDWLYFRSYAGDRWAVSPSHRIRRSLNISEFYNL